MTAPGRPVRRLSRRARIVMLLFVLPVLIFSASTDSDEDTQPDKAATVLPNHDIAGEPLITRQVEGALLSPSRKPGDEEETGQRAAR